VGGIFRRRAQNQKIDDRKAREGSRLRAACVQTRRPLISLPGWPDAQARRQTSQKRLAMALQGILAAPLDRAVVWSHDDTMMDVGDCFRLQLLKLLANIDVIVFCLISATFHT